jgi:hypothetical protein
MLINNKLWVLQREKNYGAFLLVFGECANFAAFYRGLR